MFDYQKLEWFNGSYMRQKTPSEFAALIAPQMKEAGFIEGGPADTELLEKIAPLIQERVKMLPEAAPMVRFLFEEPAAPAAQDLIPKKGNAAGPPRRSRGWTRSCPS